jgi:hypothetical protein
MVCAIEAGWLVVDPARRLGKGCDGEVWKGTLWEREDVAVKQFYMLEDPRMYGIVEGSVEQAAVFAKIKVEAK